MLRDYTVKAEEILTRLPKMALVFSSELGCIVTEQQGQEHL